MKKGDAVRVWPHGEERLATTGVVAIISENQRSIAVGFMDSRPPFAPAGVAGAAIHPDFGIMLFAAREEINGKPCGPWVEMFGEGHYEIEAEKPE